MATAGDGGAFGLPSHDEENRAPQKLNRQPPSSHGKSGSAMKTPSKPRVDLGNAANFYFKYLNSSAKKTPKPSKANGADGFYLGEPGLAWVGGDEEDADATGMISITSLHQPAVNESAGTARANDTSLISLGLNSSTHSGSTSSSSEGDMLNKSTLSDTTDLTASSFVLQATSRQVLYQLSQGSSKKQKKKTTELEATLAGLQQSRAQASAPESNSKPQESAKQPGDVMATNEILGTNEIEHESVVASQTDRNHLTPTGKPTNEEKLDSEQKRFDSTKKTIVLAHAATPGSHVSERRRRSFRGASPSIRQRMSATPQSLKKLTQDLKSQRVNRQVRLKEEALRRLSSDSFDSIQSLNQQLESLTADHIDTSNVDTATMDRKRLPPYFSRPSPTKRGSTSTGCENVGTKTMSSAAVGISAEEAASTIPSDNCDTGDSTSEIMGAMKEIFGSTSPTAKEDKKKRSSITARASDVDRVLHDNNPVGQPGSSETDSSEFVMDHVSESKAQETEKKSQNSEVASPEEREGPERKLRAPLSQKKKSSVDTTEESLSPSCRASIVVAKRLTPGPTPTKLPPTPRRIVNPRALDSPARNTRSSAKKKPVEGTSLEEIQPSSPIRLRFGGHQSEDDAKALVLRALPEVSTQDGQLCLDASGDHRGGERNDDTASLGDLTSILGSQSQNGVILSPSGAESVAQLPEVKNLEETPASTSNFDDTASLADLSSLLGTQSANASKTPNGKTDSTMVEMEASATRNVHSKQDTQNVSSPPVRLHEEAAIGDKTSSVLSDQKFSAFKHDALTSPPVPRETNNEESPKVAFNPTLSAQSEAKRDLLSNDETFTQEESATEVRMEVKIASSPCQSEAETASLGDLAEILSGSQNVSDVQVTTLSHSKRRKSVQPRSAKLSDFLDTTSKESDVSFEGEQRSLMEGLLSENKSVVEDGLSTAQSTDDTASMEGLSGISGSQSQIDPIARSPITPGRIKEIDEEGSRSSVLKSSPSNSEGDTASLGDLTDLLGSQSTNVVSITPPVKFDSPQNMESPSLTRENAAVGKNMESTPAGVQPKMSQTSFGSAESSKSQPNYHGDTASVGDIQDILGTEPSSNSFISDGDNSPGSCHSKVKTQLSQSPSDSSSQNLSQKSLGSVERHSSTREGGDETASIGDLAEILGTASSQSQDSISTSGEETESIIGLEQPSDQDQDVTARAEVKDSAVCSQKIDSPGRSEPSSNSNNPISSGRKRRLLSNSLGQSSEDPQEVSRIDNALSPGSMLSPAIKSRTSKSPLQLTPNSHVKLTPTKIKPSPRRILNPKHGDSPARNTRSAKKLAMAMQPPGTLFVDSEGDNESHSQESRSSKLGELKLSSSPSTTEVGVARSKRRRSSVEAVLTVAPNKENPNIHSPLPTKNQPVGILSSRKRSKTMSGVKSSQRSVAFGSPEAALYHIGSPSVNMTPMPSSKAKLLFSIPRGNPSDSSSDFSNDGGDRTVEIETDLNVLVDKMTVDHMKESPALSPIVKSRDDTGPVVMPGNYQLGTSQRQSPSALAANLSTDASSCGEATREDMTVELEGAMDGLLSNLNVSEKKENPRSNLLDGSQQLANSTIGLDSNVLSPADSSVEMTDATSIASLNSAKSDKFTSQLDLGAQKLDFNFTKAELMQSVSDVEDSMDVDEGNTVELEPCMTGLLAAAGVRESLSEMTNTKKKESAIDSSMKEESQDKSVAGSTQTSTMEFDDSTCASRRSRRSSIASRRFTLTPQNKFGFSSDISILDRDQESSHTADRSVTFKSPLTSEFSIEKVEHEPLTLTFDEIIKSSFVSREEVKPRVDGALDTLVRFNEFNDNEHTLSSERWDQFLQAVCCEVERRIESDNSASESLASVFASDPGRFLSLQTLLRAHEKGDTQQVIRRLATEGQRAISSEWSTWLATVMESFVNPLNEICKELGEDSGRLEEAETACSDIQEMLNRSKGLKARRARRKSLARRKSAVAALQDEVRSLETRLAEGKLRLDDAKSAETCAEEEFRKVRSEKSLFEEVELARPEAQSSQKTYLSLKGLQSWNPLLVNSSNISIATIGSSINTCNSLIYTVSNSAEFAASRKNTPVVSDSIKRSFRKYPRSIVALLDSFQDRLANTMTINEQQPTSKLGCHLQDYCWILGRLDQTASELQRLARRYNAGVLNSGPQSFVCTVEFEGRDSKLSLEIALDVSYPAVPLELKMDLLEGEIDFEGIKKALSKNAKPGFGYLSRVCDIISAYVK